MFLDSTNYTFGRVVFTSNMMAIETGATKMKINYLLKAYYLESNMHIYQRKLSNLINRSKSIQARIEYEERLPNESEEKLLSFYNQEIEEINEEMNAKIGFNFNEDINAWQDCERINHASNKRVKHLRSRVEELLQSQCVFLTFTFNDKYLNELSYQTKRKYVQQALKKLKCSYVANVDYGKENHRIHFHAIAQIGSVSNSIWSYGAINFKKINKPNSKALSKYICKLTNHAIKETCKGTSIMYSRYTPSNKESLTFTNLGLI